MNKRRNRMIAQLVAIVMVTVLLATACNGQTVTTTTQTSATTKTASSETTIAETGLFDEKLTLTWIVYNQFDNPIKEGIKNQKLIEDRFNVELDIPEFDVHNQEQWTLYWASGNTADRIISNNMSTFFTKFADQGLIRPISMEMLEKYAPNWLNLMDSLVPRDMYLNQITYKDKVWLMPCNNLAQTQQTFVLATRKSWMDKVGLTKVPETLDDLYNMIVLYTKEDPDGNGANDTYGLHMYGSTGLSTLWGTLGVIPYAYYDIDGKITYTNTTEAYKNGLKILNKWYAEGLLDPEFVTDDRNIQRAKWTEGKFGLLEDHPWWFASSTANNLTAMITKKYQGEQLVFFKAVKGADGKSGSQIGYPQVINNGIYFGAETSDAKVARIMAIEDAIASDMDLFIELYYGTKGEHYWTDDDGIIRPVAEILTKEKISEIGLMQTFAVIPQGLDHFQKLTPKSDMPPYEMSIQNNKLYTGRNFTISGKHPSNDELFANISKIASEYYYNVVTGKVDINKTWDQYLADLDGAGLQEILKGYESIIIR